MPRGWLAALLRLQAFLEMKIHHSCKTSANREKEVSQEQSVLLVRSGQ